VSTIKRDIYTAEMKNMRIKTGHGGSRQGAGRPKGTGKYNAPTQTMRVPIEMLDAIDDYIRAKGNTLPFFFCKVQADTPTVTEDNAQSERVSLYRLIVEDPNETFVLQANGESMINAGIHPDDYLVVNRKKQPTDGAIVIASINNELTVKRLEYQNGQPCLLPENPDFEPITIGETDNVQLFGVVTHSIHAMK
jgi:DNA polymerase V